MKIEELNSLPSGSIIQRISRSSGQLRASFTKIGMTWWLGEADDGYPNSHYTWRCTVSSLKATNCYLRLLSDIEMLSLAESALQGLT